MQVNELRIGNYVNVPTQPNPVQVVCSIMPAHAGTSHTIEHLELGGYLMPYEFIEPIPLTEEWLVKLGFEKTYESAFRLKYDLPCNFIGFDFSKTEDKSMDGLRFYGRYFKIKYVHQLQNLYFALTGEELTI